MSGHCPFMTLNCLLTTGFPLDFPCPLHVSQHVLVLSPPLLSTPPSCPCHFLGMSASFSMYVPFFRCQSFPYISCRCPCRLFPFDSLCTPLVFISVPFMSLSVPLCVPFISPCFPVMSTSYFLPAFPSWHFPTCSPAFSSKKHVFPQDVKKHRVFRQKGGRKPKPAKSRQGIRAWDRCFATLAPRRLRLVGRYEVTARYVQDTTLSDV